MGATRLHWGKLPNRTEICQLDLFKEGGGGGGGLLPEYFYTIITPFSTLYEENRCSIAPKFEPVS